MRWVVLTSSGFLILAALLLRPASGTSQDATPAFVGPGSDERIAALETRVAVLETSVFGATPVAATPVAGSADVPVAIDNGRIAISGVPGQVISESFMLTDGNWFYRVDATGTGRIRVELVQVGGTNTQGLVFGDDLPYQASDSFTIYASLGYAGEYVLNVESEGPWSVTLSQTPIR